MRFVIGFLSGVLGLLAGWAGLAILVIALAGADREGGTAMGAFFNIGPIGGLIGLVAGVWLFIKFGVARVPSLPGVEPAGVESAPPRTRVSPAFAAIVVLLAAGLSWWGWYELIRSPYLSHGYMTLELQFRLPSGMALPADAKDVHIVVWEGQQGNDVTLGRARHSRQGFAQPEDEPARCDIGIARRAGADVAGQSAERSRSDARLFAVANVKRRRRLDDRNELQPQCRSLIYNRRSGGRLSS
jgi:hypothetical protein